MSHRPTVPAPGLATAFVTVVVGTAACTGTGTSEMHDHVRP
jgi:hypothetical protein